MPANLTADALLYLWTTPGTADLGYVTPEEFGHRIGATKDLPENIRRILVGQSSADRIQALVIRKHRLAVDQAQTVARILGRVLRGEESPANFRSLLTKEIEAAPDAVDDIIQVLTAEFITPNYFQINQVYITKQKESPSRAVLAPSTPSTASSNVVDLRNGVISSRLPPAPRVAPTIEKSEAQVLLPPPERPLSSAPVLEQGVERGDSPSPARPSSPPPPPTTPSPPREALPVEKGGAEWGPLPSPRRIRGTPLDEIAPKDRLSSPPPPSPPPAPHSSGRSEVGFIRPPGGGAHGPLPPASV